MASAAGSPVPVPDTATTLEIRVRRAALVGADGVNPPLALCVEAEATLFRAKDGAELYSCPVHYRGEKRKFTEWAAKDARLFRQEVQRSYREISTIIVDQLTAQGLVPPGHAPQPILARE